MKRWIEKYENINIGSSTACNIVAVCREAKKGGVLVTVKCSLGEREDERIGCKEFVEGRGLRWEGFEEWFESEFGGSSN